MIFKKVNLSFVLNMINDSRCVAKDIKFVTVNLDNYTKKEIM